VRDSCPVAATSVAGAVVAASASRPSARYRARAFDLAVHAGLLRWRDRDSVHRAVTQTLRLKERTAQRLQQCIGRVESRLDFEIAFRHRPESIPVPLLRRGDPTGGFRPRPAALVAAMTTSAVADTHSTNRPSGRGRGSECSPTPLRASEPPKGSHAPPLAPMKCQVMSLRDVYSGR